MKKYYFLAIFLPLLLNACSGLPSGFDWETVDYASIDCERFAGGPMPKSCQPLTADHMEEISRGRGGRSR